MCCAAWRRPQPRHRRLYSSPYTRTQGAKRFNILFLLCNTPARCPRSLVPFPRRVVSTLTAPNHDESSSVRHVRRMFHPGRGLGGSRARRTNMHFTSSSTGGLSSSASQSSTYTPSNREAMDPIAGGLHSPSLAVASTTHNLLCLNTLFSTQLVNMNVCRRLILVMICLYVCYKKKVYCHSDDDEILKNNITVNDFETAVTVLCVNDGSFIGMLINQLLINCRLNQNSRFLFVL